MRRPMTKYARRMAALKTVSTARVPRRRKTSCQPIFVFEGEWDSQGGMAAHRAGAYVEALAPFLSESADRPGHQIVVIRRDVHNGRGLRLCLAAAAKKCRDEGWERPILYFACHGKEDALYLSDDERDGRVRKANLPAWLRECGFRLPLVAFGACLVGKGTSGASLKDDDFAERLVKTGGALAVAAYTKEVPWLHSTLSDLLVLLGFSRLHGLRAVQANSFALAWQEEARRLARSLGLKVWRRKVGPGPTVHSVEFDLTATALPGQHSTRTRGAA